MKFNFKNALKTVERFAKQYSPEILTGIGIAGFITTAVLTGKATLKAKELIDDKKLEKTKEIAEKLPENTSETAWKQAEEEAKLSKKEVVKVAWKPFLPVVITGIASAGCCIGGISISARRTAALATAYKLSQEALETYKDKVKEEIGEEKAKELSEKSNNDILAKYPVSKSKIYETGNGTDLCYDTYSGRYFHCCQNAIERAMLDINKQMLDSDFAMMNDYYEYLGLDPIGAGYETGWNINDGLVDVDITGGVSDEGKPCLVVNYTIEPKSGKDSYA